MTRPFLIWPDPRLSAVAEPVAKITDDIHALWDDMIAAMEAMPGVGLAAPQLGVGLRVAVVDASDTRGCVVRMANPELLDVSGPKVKYHEASPNLPGVAADVVRQEEIRVRFVNAEGAVEERAFSGLWARSTQHQIDHLNGKLYVDRLSRVKRDMVLRKFRKG